MVDLFAALRGMFKPLLTSDSVTLVFVEPVDVPRLILLKMAAQGAAPAFHQSGHRGRKTGTLSLRPVPGAEFRHQEIGRSLWSLVDVLS